MDHENASDLIAPYVRGELDAATGERLSEHLRACEECRAEERGLRALLTDPVEEMSDIERARLHRHLRSELAVPEPVAGPRLAWLPPALTAAALLLVVVVGVQLFGGGADESGDADGAAGGDSQDQSIDGPEPITFGLTGRGLERARLDELAGEERTEDAGSEEAASDPASSEAAETEANGSPDAAAFGEAGSRMTKRRSPESRFTRLARSGKTFVSFAASYDAEDAGVLRDAFTARLAADAPPEARDQLVQCADFVVDSRPYPTLPAAAAHGKYRKRESLLLGFVWTREDSGPLDNYMLFVWPRATCETPTHSQIGRIRTAKG